jgi:2-dehydro-3-deoxyphosphogluconate aldolase/(4S)-4-hydroxy-2-oxoglutarate aldolase
LTPDLAAAGIASGLPYLPGAVTASEILAARELNFTFLKFFPAREAGGPALLRSFAPVFQGIVFCPTGGINEENVGAYLALPNVPVVGGTWVANREAIEARDWSGITARAKRAAALRTA